MKNNLLVLAFALLAGGAFSQNADSLLTAKVVDSLLTTANDLRMAGKNEEALPVLQQAVDMSNQKWGENNVKYITSLGRLAYTYSYLGQNDNAIELYLKVIDLAGKVLGKEHRNYAAYLTNLALIYHNNIGDYGKAEPMYLEVIEIRAKVLGKEDPLYAESLNNLSVLYFDKGDYAKAESMYLEVIEIRAKVLGKEDPLYAQSLNNLANLYMRIGDFAKSESLLLEVIETYAKTLGKEDPEYAMFLNNLALMYGFNGDYTKSESLLLEAIEIYAKTLGKEDPNYAKSLENLALMYIANGDYTKAEPMLLEGKEIIAKTLSKEHPLYATFLGNIATIYLQKRDYVRAEALLLEVKEIQEKVLGKENSEYSLTLRDLANLYHGKGDNAKAEPLFLEAIEIMAKSIGKEQHDYVLLVNDLAMFYWETNRISESAALFLELNDLVHYLIEKSAVYSSESQMLAYLNIFEEKLALLQSFAYAYPSPELSRTSFDNALFYNGYLLENARHLAHSVAGADSLTRETYERWQGCHRRLANEYAKPIAERQYVVEVEAEAEGYEKTLTRNLPAFSEARRVLHWQDVREQLRPGEAAVELIHYRYFTPKATDSTMYAALVLRPGDAQPQFVPLFEEKELTPLLRGAAGGGNFLKINALYAPKTTGAKQKSLYELIWQPLEGLLSNSKTVYCAPSGLLHRTNLAAIATDDGRVYGERRQLVVLGSTRQLVIPSVVIPSGNSANDAYLAGGIRYDCDSTAIAAANQTSSSRSLEQSGGPEFQPDSLSISRGGVLDYLPATAAEVYEIRQILSASGIKARVDTGFYATEEVFRRLGVGSPSPRIVHLATHGYFFPDPVSKMQKPGGILEQEPVFKISEHPMIRSGLVMAGAKQAWLTGKHPSGQEDGILTAYEISQMDLSGTVVVLSACETGLGDIVGNEGVYGLQRAFKIAGAKYLIMSLWKVDDRSTQEFMTSFYRHWLTEKQSVPQAFRTTQREMRAKHPGAYDWAGFVLIE